jgi:hypothetical protein
MPEHFLWVEPGIPSLIVELLRKNFFEFAEGGQWRGTIEFGFGAKEDRECAAAFFGIVNVRFGKAEGNFRGSERRDECWDELFCGVGVDFDDFCEVLLFSCGKLERANRSRIESNQHHVLLRNEVLTGQNQRLPNN